MMEKGDDGKTILGNKSKFNSFQGKLKKLGGFEDEGGERVFQIHEDYCS